MPIIFRLPDGKTASFPDGTDPAVANAQLNADNPELYGIGKQGVRRNKLVAEGERRPDEYTTGDRFKKAFDDFESQSGEFRGLVENRLGNTNEGTGFARIAANRLQAEDAQNIAPPAMDYREINGIGSGLSYLGENLIQSAPQMASSAIGALGAVATLPVSGPVALGAGLGAGAIANLPSYGGQNIDDQIQELMANGLTEEQALQRIQLGPAAISGALQSGLDALPIATAVGKPLVSIGKPLVESVGKRVAATKIGETAAGRIAGRVGMRAGETAIDEAVSEAAQQALQIGQSGYVSGEGIGDSIARRSGEIGDAAIAGGLIGGGLGGAGGVIFPNNQVKAKPTVTPPSDKPEFSADSFTPGQRGTFTYDGKQYEGTYRGMGPYKAPIFRVQNADFPAGEDLQVQPGDIIGMQQEQALLPAPDSTLYAGSAGVGTSSAMDALRKQVAPLLPEETQPQAGQRYSALQQQIIDYQNKEADRRAAEEDALRKRIEQQNKEALYLKRQKESEYLANEQLASKVAETRISDAIDTPRLTFDDTLAVTPKGVAIPRSSVIQQAVEKKQAKRDTAQKRIDDGYDPSIEPPAQVIDRAPIPADPAPAAPVAPRANPDFDAGPLVKNRHADYTAPSAQTRKWIEGTVTQLNDSEGGKRLFTEADGQGGTQKITGWKGTTPAWFTAYNENAVEVQKQRNKLNKSNSVVEDKNKKPLPASVGILTRKQVTDVSSKLLEGKPLGKAEARIAEVIYAEAKRGREENARQIQDARADRSRVDEDSMGDAYEPNLPPADTSLDDIPLDIPPAKEASSTQRFKGETAINRVAAERGAITSKVIEKNGHYDPLTESKYFPEDAAVSPDALDSKPKNLPKNNQWKKEKIEVTLDDGSKQKVAAGAIAANLKKMASDLQKLKACLG